MYGAYFATAALAHATQITALDAGTDRLAGYAIFTNDTLARILLINTNYYAGSGTRENTTFSLTGINASSLSTLRLTAPSAYTTLNSDGMGPITVAGQSFDSSCGLTGHKNMEKTSVHDGKSDIALRASEAVLLYLD